MRRSTIAIGVWLVWYELQYGIEARKESRRTARNLSRKWKAESDAKWKEFSEARKSEKAWKEYLHKQVDGFLAAGHSIGDCLQNMFHLIASQRGNGGFKSLSINGEKRAYRLP
jgi:hypothetical protein